MAIILAIILILAFILLYYMRFHCFLYTLKFYLAGKQVFKHYGI